MDSHREEVSLSERERSALAELDALITASDPEFSRQLDRLSRPLQVRKWWLAPALIAVGAMIVLVAFTVNLWLAVAGAALMAVGLGLALPQVAAAGSGLWQRTDPDA